MIPLVFNKKLRGGKNATHNFLGIWINPDLKYYDAILAQEKYEWWFLQKWGLAFSIPTLVALFILAPSIFILLPALFAHILGPTIFYPIRQEMEVNGQTLELVFATTHNGADFDKYYEETIKSLKNYSFLKKIPEAELRRRVNKFIPKAKEMVK